MSQHLATATLDGHPVEIVAGFDRRLGDYFLQVIDERNDMLYTSLQEPLLDWTDIATLRTKVAELGLRLPAKLVDEVVRDDADKAWSQAALRKKRPIRTRADRLDATGHGHVFGQVEIMELMGSRDLGNGRVAEVRQAGDHRIEGGGTDVCRNRIWSPHV